MRKQSIYLQGMYGITRETGFTSLEILVTIFDYSGSQISKMGVQIDHTSRQINICCDNIYILPKLQNSRLSLLNKTTL